MAGVLKISGAAAMVLQRLAPLAGDPSGSYSTKAFGDHLDRECSRGPAGRPPDAMPWLSTRSRD
jgi:hypothetical protein